MTVVCRRVRTGSSAKESLNDGFLTHPHCCVQRRHAVAVAWFHIHLARKEKCQQSFIAGNSRPMESRSAQWPVVSLTRDGCLKTHLKKIRSPFHHRLKTFEIAGPESEKILNFTGKRFCLRWAIRPDLRLYHGL